MGEGQVVQQWRLGNLWGNEGWQCFADSTGGIVFQHEGLQGNGAVRSEKIVVQWRLPMLWESGCSNVGLESAVTMLCENGGGIFVGMRCVSVLFRNVDGCAILRDAICYAAKKGWQPHCWARGLGVDLKAGIQFCSERENLICPKLKVGSVINLEVAKSFLI